MNLITREILHPDLTVNCKVYFKNRNEKINIVKKVTRKEISNDINRAKAFLIQEKKFKRGDKVVLGTSYWPEYLVWFFAVAELGGSFVVSDSPAVYNTKVIDYRLSLYDKIDHFIYGCQHQSFSSLADVYINELDYVNYQPVKYISKMRLCEPDDILLYSTSSGTTSIPKVVSHTHEFFFQLMIRNKKVFLLNEEDRCLHSKNLHHGSVLGVYFLPTINYCKSHYWQVISTDDDWVDNFIDFIKKYKINRCLLYSNQHLDMISSKLSKNTSSHCIKFNLLSGFSSSTIDHIVGKCKHEIISIFGCTETSGPTFLLNLNADNYSTRKYNNFGTPLDNFYDIFLDNDQLLNVKMPDGTVICTGDQMEIINGEYHHLRRASGMKINDVPIYQDLLAAALNNFCVPNSTIKLKHAVNYDLCLDSDKKLIYIRSDFDLDLRDINRYIETNLETTSYNISYILVDKREKYLGGIKLDAEKLRRDCRLRLGISI